MQEESEGVMETKNLPDRENPDGEVLLV